MINPISFQLDVSELKIPYSEPSWFASQMKPGDIDEKNTKINFSSVPRELVSFPMEEQQRITHISSRVLVQTL